MQKNRKRVARDYVSSLYRLAAARHHLLPLPDVLVLSGDPQRAAIVTAVLRSAVGYQTDIKAAGSLGECLDLIAKQAPGLLIIDDVKVRPEWSPRGLAMTALPVLRRFGFTHPILVVAVSPSRERVQELLSEGASDIIDQDDLLAVRLVGSLQLALVGEGAPALV